MESRALGKGLASLIPEKSKLSNLESILNVKTSEIRENAYQPRSAFDSEKLTDLIASVKEKGVLQPLLVRKKDEGYEVIAGERRLRAARALGMEEVPVVVRNVSDQEAFVLALIENIQREELNPIEEAKAFKRLVDEFKLSQDDVAQSVGKERSTISNSMRLLKLPKVIQEAVSAGSISMGHARTLLAIEEPYTQKKLFARTMKNGLSVRELENLTKPQGTTKKRKQSKAREKIDAYLLQLEEDFQRCLGTKVRILPKQKRGKIVIDYYSPTDLERIAETIRKESERV